MCNKHLHSTMTWSSRFHCPIGVINKLTTDELWISLAVAKFSKSTMEKLLTWPWPCPLREHSLITRLRLHMADPCTKFEVSSVSHCGDISHGVKFYNVSRDPDHAPFGKYFSLAGWDLLPLTYKPNLKFLTTPITKIWEAVQNVQIGVVSGA